MESRDGVRSTRGRKWKRSPEACTFCRRRKVRTNRPPTCKHVTALIMDLLTKADKM